jgi:tRNA-specific 2-thiouridylase
LYVLRIDAEKARVVVGGKKDLLQSRVTVRDINWIGSGDAPIEGQRVTVKLRSTSPPVPARLHPTGEGRVEVVLDAAQGGVAPGQACVFYDNERVLGGGWISAA